MCVYIDTYMYIYVYVCMYASPPPPLPTFMLAPVICVYLDMHVHIRLKPKALHPKLCLNPKVQLHGFRSSASLALPLSLTLPRCGRRRGDTHTDTHRHGFATGDETKTGHLRV